VTFRANQRFNFEVTRLRTTGEATNPSSGPPSGAASGDPATADPGLSVGRLANVITGKLRQLPGEIPNALMMVASGLQLGEDSLIAAMRLLKMHTDSKDDSFFARRGLKDARDFYAQYLHLSGIFVVDEATAPPRALFAPNREARHPLPKETVTALMQCLTGPLRGE
jgi:hypothetical protein